MMLFAVPGLGSVSGFVHLAVRRPYVAALAVGVIAAAMFANTVTRSSPALSHPPVPSAPVVQHTPRPAAVPGKTGGVHALGHRQNPGREAKVHGQSTVSSLEPGKVASEQWIR
jgi:hypothetical protein